MRQIVLDTETTGLEVSQGHRIIEIGCVELINRKLTGKRFHHYINPEREIDEGALAVHGIKNEFLKEKPFFADISQSLLDFISGDELIIHNASFDIGFLDYELKLIDKKWKSMTKYCRIIDTLLLARQLHMGQRNSLDALCKRYGIDHSQRELHGALLDATLLAQVYLAMTGGQGNLFDELEVTESIVPEKPSLSSFSHSAPLRVLKADADEITSHEDYLKHLLKQGKCLWLENE